MDTTIAPKCNCGAPCAYAGTKDQPCWGEVVAVDDVNYGEVWGWEWVHACQGHVDAYDYGDMSKYKPEPTSPERS